MTKLEVGDKIYSPFFDQEIKIVKIDSDKDWWFEIQGQILKAETPLSYFERKK